MTVLRVFVVLAALFGLYVAGFGISMATVIIAFFDEWMGGIDPNLTALWFAISALGCGFTGLASLLALFGAFIRKGRAVLASFLLLIPGFLGVLMAGAAFFLLVRLQPDWQRSIFIVGYIGGPSVIFFVAGIALAGNQRRY